jgi:hypothetical protein
MVVFSMERLVPFGLRLKLHPRYGGFSSCPSFQPEPQLPQPSIGAAWMRKMHGAPLEASPARTSTGTQGTEFF